MESFGLVALEAQSCGVPVIATNIGGIPEAVADGETGYLLPVGDVAGMANKALVLLSDNKLYQQFQQRARERAVQHFDSNLLIAEYESYYQEILNKE